MLVEGTCEAARLKIADAADRDDQPYKPSVDLTFESVAKVFSGDIMSVILTGMGADGKEGCREIKKRGGKVWAQDEATSVVYGMPQAVTVANISERSLAIETIASSLLTEMQG